MEEKVSVIVRTCGRPEVLRTALDSLRKQTYQNIEIIVEEDGENHSEAMIKKEYADLNISYEATGQKCGRTKAGNMALKRATGRYFNFLDDDDYFLPEHIELLVDTIEKSYNKAAYAVAEECAIEIKSKAPYRYEEKGRKIMFRQPFNKMLLCYTNYFPIQSVLFDRALYDSLGGFDENLEVLEDWDVWLRYATKTDFSFLDQVTSVYHVPYGNNGKTKRDAELYDALLPIHGKLKNYQISISEEQINREIYDLLNNYKEQKNLLYYLKRLFFYLKRKDR